MVNTMTYSTNERTLLRELGRRKADIGHLPVQLETAQRWRDLNGLRLVRPLVWINEIPWGELQPRALELAVCCRDPFLAGIERGLRQELYQWDHFRCDMVVDPVVYCSIAGGPSSVYADYGLQPRQIEQVGAENVLFDPVIRTDDDVEKIRTPQVWYDHDETRRRLDVLREIFDGVIEVRRRGIVHQWHTPWDMAVRWYGVEPLLMDLIDRPERVARVAERVCQATNDVLDQQQSLGMLDVGSGNWRVGSGGLGFCDELPAAVTGRLVTPADQWGCGNAQIFSEVSPEMHEEFSLRFERPVMERFGLSYYGCCEPLHRKMHILRRVRNLRKISMSPKADLRVAAEAVGSDYVISFKPSPAYLAPETFRPEQVRADLRDALDKLRGVCTEVILKDITTVRGEPERLERWAAVAMEVAQSSEQGGGR